MKKHQFVSLTAFVLVCLLLSVVPAALAQDNAITLDFYFPTAADGPASQVFQGYADQFHELYPNITVNPVYTGSYTQTRDTIQTEVNAGDVIVDVAVMLATDLYSFVEEESVVPAQDFIDQMDDADAYVSDFFPAFMANGTDEMGVIWSIPFQRSIPVMYYNADLLEAEGIAVPTNNEELLAAAQALTTPDRWGLEVAVAGNFPIWLYQSFAAAYGQPLTEADPTVVYFNTPESLAGLEFLTKLGTEYGVGPVGGSVWGDTPTDFTSGHAAMIYHTIGSLTSILQNADFTVGVAPMPSGPAGMGIDGTGYGAPTGGGNLYIFASSTPEEQEAAWLWVQFLSSPEIQSDWGANFGYIAARQSAWDLEPLKSLAAEHPQYLQSVDAMQYAVGEFAAYRSIDIQNIINVALSGVISGATPIEDTASVLATAQEQIDSLLADYK
ncbi:MAG: ABC transporter substrate-binding protein [Anaerolineaceae bacterium]|nr:ABC transporter substrate-binding protein [Anaerolineaceae bacterium]